MPEKAGQSKRVPVPAAPVWSRPTDETAPIPRIVAEAAAKAPKPTAERTGKNGRKRSLADRIGDTPMRVIYRNGGIALAVVLVLAAGLALYSGRTGPIKAVAIPATPTPTPTYTSTPTPTPTPEPRVPPVPADRKLSTLPGKASPVRGRIIDRKSGLTYAQLAGDWKTADADDFGAAREFDTEKVRLPRALLASLPLPVTEGKDLRTSAVAAAEWTLRQHPEDARIRWEASQSIKVSRVGGWLLVFHVDYAVAGAKATSSLAAVVVADVKKTKPALLFVTIPDTHKERWRDINVLIASLRTA